MSSTLMWRPQSTGGEPLSFELKKTLSRRLWDTDGSCGRGEAIVGTGDIEYIEGLRDAGVKGADHLRDLVRKYGAIVVWHEY